MLYNRLGARIERKCVHNSSRLLTGGTQFTASREMLLTIMPDCQWIQIHNATEVIHTPTDLAYSPEIHLNYSTNLLHCHISTIN